MTKHLISLAAALALATPSIAQEEAETPPSPNEIIAQAQADEWVAIAPEDLLVMTLAPDAEGNEREVVIQLIPAPFSEAWTSNIRTFARAGWYDNITVNRVQDNYVVQWGDANYDNPEAEGNPKELPAGLGPTDENDYAVSFEDREQSVIGRRQFRIFWENFREANGLQVNDIYRSSHDDRQKFSDDAYARAWAFHDGWPYATDLDEAWLIHCYGMVGVGRNYSPDAGTGAELYTVIGHAPRHLDRNIALVGRIVEGIEHLSSLPRGKGQLGFYEDETRRTPILTVRVATDLPPSKQPLFEYLDSGSKAFAHYAEARANRRDPFFNVPAGGADVCNIPIPVRRVAE